MDELIWKTARDARAWLDAAFTALVAIESLGLDAEMLLSACAEKARTRLT